MPCVISNNLVSAHLSPMHYCAGCSLLKLVGTFNCLVFLFLRPSGLPFIWFSSSFCSLRAYASSKHLNQLHSFEILLVTNWKNKYRMSYRTQIQKKGVFKVRKKYFTSFCLENTICWTQDPRSSNEPECSQIHSSRLYFHFFSLKANSSLWGILLKMNHHAKFRRMTEDSSGVFSY